MIHAAIDEKRYSLAKLILIASVFILASPVFWMRVEQAPNPRGESFAASTFARTTYPLHHYISERLKSGEIPLWTSQQLCGAPILADPRTAVLQPLHLVFLAMPIERALVVHVYVCLFLMGFFFALFVRSVGAAYIPALLGGVAFAYSGISTATMYHPGLASSLAWTPLLFWSIREYGEGFRRSWAILIGFAAAFVLFGGAAPFASTVLPLALVYGLAVALFPQKQCKASLWRRISGLGIAMLLAIAISAAQWIPTLAWLSTQENPMALLTALDIPLREPSSFREALAQLLAPQPSTPLSSGSFHTLPRAGYLGVTTVLLLPAVLLGRQAKRERLFFALLGVFSLGMFAALPNSLPIPLPQVALMFPASISLSLLAGLGADRLLAPKQRHRLWLVWAPCILVVLGACALFLITSSQGRGIAVVFVLVLIPYVLFPARWMGTLSCTAMTALLFTELAISSTNSPYQSHRTGVPYHERYDAVLGEAVNAAGAERLIIVSDAEMDDLPANSGFTSPGKHVGGEGFSLTKDEAAWWRRLSRNNNPFGAAAGQNLSRDPAELRLLSVMAARAALYQPAETPSPNPLSSQSLNWHRTTSSTGESALAAPKLDIYINSESLPRAYWAPRWRSVDGIGEAATLLSNPTFDLNTTCVVDADSTAAHLLVDDGEAVKPKTDGRPFTWRSAACVIEQDTQEEISIEIEAPAQGILILADTYAPGWRAYVDGVEQEILKVNGIFRGLVTPQGKHSIRFTYRPLSVMIGFGVSLATLGLLVLAGVAAIARRV